MKTHLDLKVWQKSVEFVTEIYRFTDTFPERETFGLTSQVRRSSISIPSNIAEGAAKASAKDFKRFLNIALGSCVELETQIIISRNLNYLDEQKSNQLLQGLAEIRRMIIGLKKSLSN